MPSASTRLLEAIDDYLSVPKKNEDVVRAFLGGNKRHLVQELIGEGSTKSAALRQIERWTTGAQQKRNPANIRKETRNRLVMILWKRRTPVTINVSGVIITSNDHRERSFDIPPETIPQLSHLLGMLKIAAYAAEHEAIWSYTPEESACNVLTGLYFGDPPEPLPNESDPIVDLPWNDSFEYQGARFTIDELVKGKRRKGAA